MKSKIFANAETPVQFICTDGKVITLETYYSLSTTQKINDNYRHLYLTQDETDVIELLNNKIVKPYLLHLYAKHTKEYIHSNNLPEELLLLWYVENITSEEFQGYVIEINVEEQDIQIFHHKNIYVHVDIAITREEFDAISTLYDLHSTLAYPTAIEIAKQYQPTLKV